MIITRLRGGLGNQMFQYALGRHLSIKNNTELVLDTSYLAEPEIASPREFELGVFDIKTRVGIEGDLEKFKKSKLYNKLNKILRFNKSIVNEYSLNFDKNILKTNNFSLIDGYWQSEKYFKNIKDTLLEDFTLKNKLNDQTQEVLEKIKESNSISIHIRRGDYVTDKKTNKHHGTCSLEYYIKAIKYISQKIKSPIFYIFSDDINWAKENLKIEFPVNFIGNNTNFEDLELMKNCKHNIIANSSFSWWAAWLNKNEEKIIIAPEKWLNNPKYNTIDVIPEDWVKI